MSFATKNGVSLGAIALTASLGTSFAATAQDSCGGYPDKPVSIIVGYSPGGGTDAVARLLAAELSQGDHGQPFAVVNMPGGAQVPAMKHVIGSEKDGYTLSFFSSGSAVMATLLRDQGFTWLEEFAPVSNIGVSTSVLAVNANSKARTAQEMIDWIKESDAAGSRLRYAHAGRGSSSHIAIASWLDANGLYGMVQDVPFEGSGPARAALIGGQVDFAGMNIAHVENFEEVVGIGAISNERDPKVNSVPTMKEQGIPYVDMDGPLLLAAPTGVPTEVVACLDAMVREVSEDQSFIDAMDQAGFAVIYQDTGAITERMEVLVEAWKPVVEQVLQTAASN